jgi:CO/xanthine dehydrogenase FAD-binding subunit
MVAGPNEVHQPDAVLDLLGIDEIRGIERTDSGLRIGAVTSFNEIRNSAQVRVHYPILTEAASIIGGWQIQNRATLGGNIVNASPAGDSLPVLLVLDATLIVAGPGGRRQIPYRDFHTGYRETQLHAGELLAFIDLPKPRQVSVQRFRKVGTREAQAISKVVSAFSATRRGDRLDGVRWAAGSVAPTPVRLTATETVCEGALLNEDLADRAAEAAMAEVSPIDDVRSTAEYRRWALGRIVRRMLLSCLERPAR